jgi:hypothetical protein
MSWVWPKNTEYQAEIPAWIRFDAYNFDSDITVRNKDIQNFWNSPYFVSVPLPTKIGTDLNMDYTTNSSRISTDRNFIPALNVQPNFAPGTLYDPKVGERNLRLPGRDFDKSNVETNDNRETNTSFLDIIDTTWLGQSRRIYTFDINMICKSIEDSETAASICNYMNAGALPILSNINRNSIVGNQKSIHPAMWAIHVNDTTNDANKATRMWLGEYPQLCVLQKVNGTRIGGDGNQIIGMSNLSSVFSPIIYNLKLIFVELEPVYRNGLDNISRSRSQFIR